MNILFSYSVNDDHMFEKEDHIFLGVGKGQNGEVHVWLDKNSTFAEQHLDKIREKVNDTEC